MLSRLKAIAAALLCHPVVGRALRVLFGDRLPCRRVPGMRISADSPAVSASSVAKIFWGIYESAELRFVCSHLRPDLDVIELGSSIGVVSSAIAMRLEPGRRLVCVEANPKLLPLLRRNAERHGPGLRIETIHGALDYDHERVRFTEGASNTAGRTALDDDAAARPGVGDAAGFEVPAVTLSGVAERAGLREFALVSDVEGAEVAMIQRDSAGLARCRQLVIELHPGTYEGRAETLESFRAALVAQGFEVRAARGAVQVFERRDDP